MEEATTVPLVYFTIYYSLFFRARMKRGSSILVHAGSGAVGIAAITLALHHACEIYVTVSTEQKKQFLLTRFPQLKTTFESEHFFSSRNTDFEYSIAQLTHGKGVDIVLNSLAEEMLFASVRCLKTYGHFLEIGKFDLARNSKLGMEIFLRSITFYGILIDEVLMNEDRTDALATAALLQQGIDDGVVKSLPRVVYSVHEVEDAIRFMAQGKHMGKILLKIRDEEEERGPLIPDTVQVSAVARAYCKPGNCYLITGGLGGLGLELAAWLVNRGATHLVLTSRSGVRSGYQARYLAHWRSLGVRVVVSRLDAADSDQCRELLETCECLGPVGGIFHLAMVLKDGLIENLTPEDFQESTRIKLAGTKNLDRLSRLMCPELLWFVCFSSMTAGRGNTGQAAYGWANAAMERVCEHRHSQGFPALAIDWGAIGDVGVILDSGLGTNDTVVAGTLPQRIPSCFKALDMFLAWGHWLVGSFVRAPTSSRGQAIGSAQDILDSVARILGVPSVEDMDQDVLLLNMRSLRAMVTGEKEDAPQKDEQKEEMPALPKIGIMLPVEFLRTLPVDVLTPLNAVTEGPRVFFVHPIEGFAEPLKLLGAELKVGAYCFQCVEGVPADSIPAMASHYYSVRPPSGPSSWTGVWVEELKREGVGEWHLVGYSYGASVALEMGLLAQAEGRPLASLTLIDSSPAYLAAHREFYATVAPDRGETRAMGPAFESQLLTSFMIHQSLLAGDGEKLQAELLAAGSWEERLDVGVRWSTNASVREFPERATQVATGLRDRYSAGDSYEGPRVAYRGVVNLLKSKAHLMARTLPPDYGLSSVVEGEVRVRGTEWDHSALVTDGAADTARFLHNIIRPR